MVLKPDKEAQARAIFEKWGLDFAVVGETTDTCRFVVRHRGVVEADLPIRELGDEAPEYDRPWVEHRPQPPLTPDAVPAPRDAGEALVALMGSPDLCSRRWVWEQYDHLILGNTVQRPGGDAAVIRIDGTNRAIAATADVTPRYCEADPVEGGRQAVAEAWRNLTAVGAEPLAVTDNLNFGNPERPEIMGQLVGCIRGIGEACRALAFPIVSGNVSLYNETDGVAIPPTPTIGGVGLIDDLAHHMVLSLDREGLDLLVIGAERGHLGRSLYQRNIVGEDRGAPPPVDLSAERAAGDLVLGLIRNRLVEAVHDCSDGGLAVAIAEMALAGGVGADVRLDGGDIPHHALLFGEDQGRYVVACDPAHTAEVMSRAGNAGVAVRLTGRSGGSRLTLPGAAPISLDSLREVHEGWLPRYMDGD